MLEVLTLAVYTPRLEPTEQADKGKTMSAGTEFAKMARKHFHMNTRTRTYRGGWNMKDQVLEAIANSNNYPGYYSEEKSVLFRAAYPVFNSYIKHVKGHRIDGMTAFQIERMTPWQWVGFLGEMIDAGVTNNFEGELFFQNMRKAQVAA